MIDFEESRKQLLKRLSPYLLFLPLLVAALTSTFVLWGEEFGWRGYLQQRLFATQPVKAAVVCGLIWGVWHYPIMLRPNSTYFPNNPLTGLVIFPVTTVFWSYILGWLQRRTKSSWAPSLAHASLNTVGSAWLSFLVLGSRNWTWIHWSSVLSWVPLALICSVLFHLDRPNRQGAQ